MGTTTEQTGAAEEERKDGGAEKHGEAAKKQEEAAEKKEEEEKKTEPESSKKANTPSDDEEDWTVVSDKKAAEDSTPVSLYPDLTETPSAPPSTASHPDPRIQVALQAMKFSFYMLCQVAGKFMIEDDEEQMKEELKEAFRIYDKEGQGFITNDVLKEILREIDPTLTE